MKDLTKDEQAQAVMILVNTYSTLEYHSILDVSFAIKTDSTRASLRNSIADFTETRAIIVQDENHERALNKAMNVFPERFTTIG